MQVPVLQALLASAELDMAFQEHLDFQGNSCFGTAGPSSLRNPQAGGISQCLTY